MQTLLARAKWSLAVAVLAACVTVGGGAWAQNRYYIDSINGADDNDGRSADHAWKTLTNVEKIRLNSGDALLLRRGGSWSGQQITLRSSGRPGRPITISGYGTGPSPILTDAAMGIDGNGQSYIVIRDMRIQNMKGPAIRSTGSVDWRIEKVTIDRTGLGHDGSNMDFAGIQLWKSRDIVIDGATLTNVHGDGIWGWELQNVRIINSHVEVCQGGSADNVHLHAPRGYELRNNFFSMEGKTDSGKGNIHSQGGTNGIIENNVFRGGNYGVGITDDNLLIRRNQFFNHNHEKWSASILMSEVYDIHNNTIIENTMTNATMGIYIFRDKYTRENFRIEDNVFKQIKRSAMVIESPISGIFAGNVLEDSPGAVLVQSNDWVVRGQKWQEAGNRIVPADRARSGQAQ